MARTLTAARAMVQPEREAAYLALLGERKQVMLRAGGHFWVFRSRAEQGLFLEFAEVPDGREATTAERAAERRLRELASYGPDADERWDEVAVG